MASLMAALLLVMACSKSQGEAPAANVTDLINKGLQAQFGGDSKKAAKLYRQALTKEPGNKYALYNLGLIDQQANNLEAAEKYYRGSLAADPNFSPALFNLAIIRTTTAPEEAVQLYRQALAVNPADAPVHLNLGFLLISLGQKAEGDAELQRAVELDPKLAARVGPPQAAPSPTSK